MLLVPSKKSDESSLAEAIEPTLNYIGSLFCCQEDHPAGALLWNHLVEISAQGVKCGLPAHLLRQSKESEDHVNNSMTTKLHDYFLSGIRVDFGNHWDRFLVDFNIKHLAVETLKICSWVDLSEDKKTVLYRDYAARAMPDSEKIFFESY